MLPCADAAVLVVLCMTALRIMECCPAQMRYTKGCDKLLLCEAVLGKVLPPPPPPPPLPRSSPYQSIPAA